MSIELLGTLLLLNFVGIISPGPDMFLILRLSAKSRPHALSAVAGICLGVSFWVALTVAGAAVILRRHPELLGLIQFFGGLWLLYMSYGLLKQAKLQWGTRPVDIDMDAMLGTLWSNFRFGLLTNLSNPKIVLYFAAIMAPILPTDSPVWVSWVLGLIIVAQAFLVFSCLALFVSTARVRRRLLAAGPYIDGASGTFFLVAGIVLIINGSQALVGLL